MMNHNDDAVHPDINEPTPVYLLAGFLGSGKTTLLLTMLERFRMQGKKAAVIMNELGDINLESQLLGSDIPKAELLGGCICCSNKGDLGMEIHELMNTHRPDVIVIESTGAANPLEAIDGITEASLYQKVRLQGVITVVDGPQLLEKGRVGKGKTYKLLLEGIRCASLIILGKADKLEPEQLVEAQQLLREINGFADIVPAVKGQLKDWTPIEALEGSFKPSSFKVIANGSHHSHGHVMAETHYLRGAVDSEVFEQFLRDLPDDIIRAKGIVTFSDTSSGSRFLFQYAYKETDFLRIEPQGEVHDVAVFIGEHFSREELLSRLKRLEGLNEDE